MKKQIFTLQYPQFFLLLLGCLTFAVSTLNGQDITVSGCSAGTAINGDYSLNGSLAVCESCTSYERVGGGVFIFRSEANSAVWAGTTNPINCLTIPYAMLTGESDCDPANAGTTSVNGCVITAFVLPVEMMWFEAEVVSKKDVRLKWEVSSETNNKGFVMERSTDGVLFEEIGFVEGRGNATDALEYEYNDEELATGKTYYYRIKQVDFDGKFEHFNIVSATLKGPKTALGEFYPNPTFDYTLIDIVPVEDQEWSVEAFDLSGKLIKKSLHSFAEGQNKFRYDVSSFTNGLYFIIFENGTDRIYRKLSIQHQ